MNQTYRDRLRDILKRRAVVKGAFHLASGGTTDYYVDAKAVLLDGEFSTILGDTLYEMTRDLEFDAVGGPEIGAVPMTVALLQSYYRSANHDLSGKPIPRPTGFFVRKSQKHYGRKRRVEGDLNPGNKVILLEDTLTTGRSVKHVVHALEELGVHVIQVIALLDRQEGAQQNLLPIPLRSILTAHALGLTSPTPTGEISCQK